MDCESIESEFQNCIYFVKEDETVLWMLRWIPRNEFGTRFVAWLILKITEKKTGTKTIRDILEECKEKYDLGVTKDLMDLARIIGQGNDSICIETRKKNITQDEPHPLKKVLCKFIRSGCNREFCCKFSHHPSMIWREIYSLSKRNWYSCDFPQHQFGLIFRLSKDLENDFNVNVLVPRKIEADIDKNCRIQIKGDEQDVIKCVENLRNKLSTYQGGYDRSDLSARNFVESVMKNLEKKIIKGSVQNNDSDEPEVLEDMESVVGKYRRNPEKKEFKEIKDPKKRMHDPYETDYSDEPEVLEDVESVVRKHRRNPEKRKFKEIKDPKKRRHDPDDIDYSDEPEVLEDVEKNKRLTCSANPEKGIIAKVVENEQTEDELLEALMQLPEAKRKRTMWKIMQKVPIEMLKDTIRTRRKWSD